MAADDDLVKKQLDQIIQTIGFGIVSDFRDLKKSMSDLSSDNTQKNIVIDQINDSVSSVDKQLKTFEKEAYREKNNREFRRLEESLERRSKINMQQSDNTLAKVLATVEKLKEQVAQANKNAEAAPPSGAQPPGAAPPAGGGSLLGTGAALGGGALLGGGVAPAAAAAPAATSGALATAVEVGTVVGGASLITKQLQSAAITPTSTIAPVAKEVAGITEAAAAPAKSAVTAGGKSAAEKAGNVVGAVMKTKTAKALEKVTAKSSSYIAKFGPKIASAIGSKNIPIFGTLVGGYFAFQRFFAGDSWTAIGAEFVSGITTEVGLLVGGPPGAVAGFAASLAIQAYLISRDIYTAENAADIQAGVVPNFDDLPAGDKKAVIVAVGAQVSAYVNSLFGASKTSDATVAKPPEPGAQMSAPSPTPALAAAAPAATASAASMAELPSAAGGPPAPSAPVAPAPTIGGGSVPPPASPAAGPSATAPSARGPAPMENESSARSTPVSDTTATFSTQSDLAAGTGGQAISAEGSNEISEILEVGPGYNIVRLPDGSVVRQTGARNWRNNNPGNLEYGRIAKSYGAIGSDGRFAIFPSKAAGDAAREGLLFNSAGYRDKNIAGAISRYAPPSENDTNAYINKVAGAAGADPSTPLADLTPDQRVSMLAAMEQMEGYRPGKVQVLQPGSQTPALAKGGTITPLPSDVPKGGADVAAQLTPVREVNSYEDSESMSSQPITTNKPASPSHEDSGNNKRNKIGAYTDIMSHVFGTLTDEFKKHSLGEVSADHHFERAMHPLG